MKNIIFSILLLIGLSCEAQQAKFYILNQSFFPNGITFYGKINSTVNIKVDPASIRGGIMCTSAGVGCSIAWDYNATTILTNNNVVVSETLNPNTYPTGIGYLRVFFQSTITGSQTVNVDVYKNNILIGSGSTTQSMTANTQYEIDITLATTQDFSKNRTGLKCYFY